MKKRKITAATSPPKVCAIVQKSAPQNPAGLDNRVRSKRAMVRVATRLWRKTATGIYYAILKSGGRQRWISLKTVHRIEAEQKLAALISQARRFDTGGGKLLFGDAAKVYFETEIAGRRLKPATLEDLGYNLKAIYRDWPALQTSPLGSITTADCLRWFGSLEGSRSWQRINHQLRLLKSIIEWSVEAGYIMRNPARSIKPVKRRKKTVRPPAAEHVRLLLEHLRQGGKRVQNAADMVALLAATGVRLGEAAGLRWADVDLERGVVVLSRQMDRRGREGTLKGRHDNPLPMFPLLRNVLDTIARRTGKQGRVLKVRQARGPIGTACRKLGIPRPTHHAFRHAFATLAIERGVDFKTISVWLGHVDGGKLVSDTYGHLRPEHAAEMAARMT